MIEKNKISKANGRHATEEQKVTPPRNMHRRSVDLPPQGNPAVLFVTVLLSGLLVGIILTLVYISLRYP